MSHSGRTAQHKCAMSTTSTRAAQRQKIAMQLLGSIHWVGDHYYCRCPGIHLHTTPDALRDCRVYLDRVPTVYCVHQGCAEVVAGLNHQLRSAIHRAEAGGAYAPRAPTVEEMLRGVRQEHERKINREHVEQARQLLPRILRDFAVPDAERLVGIQDGEASDGDARLLLSALYGPEDIIWIGERGDSGKPENAANFRPVSQWLNAPVFPGPLICPATFQPGVFRRTNENVLSRPYLVLEGDSVDAVCGEKQAHMAAKKKREEPLAPEDELTEADKARNRACCLAVIRWLCWECKLTLRAIVNTTGKSLHGWFDMPDEIVMAQLKVVLPAFGFDTSTLKASQPVRLPGAKRPDTRRWQRLIYLNPKIK